MQPTTIQRLDTLQQPLKSDKAIQRNVNNIHPSSQRNLKTMQNVTLNRMCSLYSIIILLDTQTEKRINSNILTEFNRNS